jgi:probable rRNA maturation factor
VVIFRKRVAGLSEAALANFAVRASRAARLRGSVQILVTSNREMQSLNRRFRSLDKPTDVLSFPAELPLQGLAGDIAISAEIAARNAKRLQHSSAEEVKILVLHGILHLAGYDHESDNGAMERKEGQLRKTLRLPYSLIERNHLPAGKRKRNPVQKSRSRSSARKKPIR